MKTSVFLTLSAAAMFLAASPSMSEPGVAVLGEKVDSGLGQLPPYSTWADPTGRVPMGHRVIGESLDDGLGELPHYSKWLDRSGRYTGGRGVTQVAAAKR